MSEWRDVLGYEGRYQISDDGRVWSAWSSRELKPFPRPKDGRLQVELNLHGDRRLVRVHVLVAEAFHGPRPPGLLACHTDGNVLNNCASNIRWDTASGNTQDALRHGTHWQVRKVSCPQGHLYDAANTYITPRGHRICRTCARDRRKGMGE